MGYKKHKENAPESLKIGVIAISTTRDISKDKSGDWIEKRIRKEHHKMMCRAVVTDEISAIRKSVRDAIRAYDLDILLLTGGTGLCEKDVTIEAIRPMFKKELTAFSSVFASLSYEEIGSAAILSRATAGIVHNCVVFSMPGSVGACKLACKELIFPEISHIIRHVRD